jgi:predicted Zn finger-like uncharacterized protein
MILTCPSCGTQYVVKDGAIPPHGRQVRCASCKHSWHQDPEPAAEGEETIAEAAMLEPSSGPEAEERAYQAAALAGDEPPAEDIADDTTEHPGETAPGEDSAPIPAGYAPVEPVAPPDEEPVEAFPASPEPAAEAEEHWTPPAEQPLDDDFSPFASREIDEPRRSPLLTILLVALLIAAAAAAFWFLAPPEWKQRIGIADSGETPLQLMMTHSDRQKIAPSGNELLSVSGRVINPTDEAQSVPPIRAQLRSSSGELVYSWTIAPPARTLPPGASATFNSTEVNVPAGGDELTITLGSVKT